MNEDTISNESNSYIYIEDNKGNKIKIDAHNYNKVKDYKWRADTKGNAITTLNGKTVYMQQIIMGTVGKKIGLYIVHLNGDKKDNTEVNLELRTRSSISHSRGLIASNTSGRTGVTKTKSGYRSRLWVNNKTIELGSSKTIEEAISKREIAELIYGIS